MAEVEATIPENSDNHAEEIAENSPEPEAAPVEAAPVEEPRRGRGRPAGAKDKAPRVTKPKVRVEPIPERKAAAKPRPAPAPEPVPEPVEPVASVAPPSPEPPSPRTLFNQTSAHLLNLRDVMNSQKRNTVAERYASRLHSWPVV